MNHLRRRGRLSLVLGLFTRLAAFGIGTNIAVAAFMVHVANGFFMNWFGQQKREGFAYHILVFAIALALMFKGGGRWALDSLIAERLTRNARAHILDHTPHLVYLENLC